MGTANLSASPLAWEGHRTEPPGSSAKAQGGDLKPSNHLVEDVPAYCSALRL